MKTNILLIFVLFLAISCKKDNEDQPIKGETVTDIDGNVYKTIKIGNQVWMAENLRVTRYRNGDAIPNIGDNNDWKNSANGARCYYDNDSATYAAIYGALYNGKAIMDTRNIAPEGWHIATNENWELLRDTLGGEIVAGNKIKEAGTAHWRSPNADADNSSGFNALPGGYRSGSLGTFIYLSELAYYWTSTVSLTSDRNYSWSLSYNKSNLENSNDALKWGFSVRCVKD